MSRIKTIREELGLRQEDLAAKKGVQRTTVTMWESGAMPRAETLIRLAKTLGVTVEELMADDDRE